MFFFWILMNNRIFFLLIFQKYAHMVCHIIYNILLLSINIRLSDRHKNLLYLLLDLKRYRPAKSAWQMWGNAIITFWFLKVLCTYEKIHSGVGAGRNPVSLYPFLYSMICRWLTTQKMCWCCSSRSVICVMYSSCIQWDMIHLVFNSRAAQPELLHSPVTVYTGSAQSVLLCTHKCFDRAHNFIHNYVLTSLRGEKMRLEA